MPDSIHRKPNSGKFFELFTHLYPNIGPFWPISVQFWPILVQCWPASVQIWPISVLFWPRSAQIGPISVNLKGSLGEYFFKWRSIFFFLEKLRWDIDLILFHRQIQQICVALRFFQLPVMSEDVITTSGLCRFQNTWTGYSNDVIGYDRKLKKS